MEHQQAEKLAPCPFCGGTDINPRAMTDCEREPDGNGAMPGCTQCGAVAPSAEVWNRRTYCTPTRQARLEEDAMKADEAEGKAGRAAEDKHRLETLLWEIDAVARYRGDEYGVPDQIDNDGKPYQSADLCERLQAIDRRGWGIASINTDKVPDQCPNCGGAKPCVREDCCNSHAFDFHAHLQRQRDWSAKTFGPGVRTQGIIDHIRKELREIEAAPHDIEEWIDVVILALDGAWRGGAYPDQIISVLTGKQAKNERREWPDWREMPEDQAIEHTGTGDAGNGAATDAT